MNVVLSSFVPDRAGSRAHKNTQAAATPVLQSMQKV